MKKLLAIALIVCSLAFAQTVFAAIALVSNTSAVGLNTFSTSSINTTGATLLIVHVTDDSSVASTLTDSKSNTWTALTKRTASTSNEGQLYYATNAIVGTGHTFTLTCTGCAAVLSVASFSGAHTTAPFDQENGAAAGGVVTTFQAGSITPTENNELVVVGASWPAAATFSIDGGYTITNQNNFSGGTNYGGGLAYIVQTTAGATNPTGSFTAGSRVTMEIASFKAAAAGSTCKGSNMLLGVGC